MGEPPQDTQTVLAFAAVVEVATGLALIVAPGLVATLLLGIEVPAAGLLLGHCFGIALLALGTACWPGRRRAVPLSAEFRGMLLYNVLMTLYLIYLGTAGHLLGPLLWPGVALHGAVTLLLVRGWRDESRPGW